MLIWLVTVGEPLPIDGNNDRLHRAGILANHLVSKGHKVVWWSSTFNHFRKEHRFQQDSFIKVNELFQINLLHSVKYKKNFTIMRAINHFRIAQKFFRYSQSGPEPDIILCSFPTIELSAVAVAYGKKRNIPVVIDVRDLWPDIFCELLPRKLKWFGKITFYPFFHKTRKLFRECSYIIGVSNGYLQWGLSYAGRSKSECDAVFPLGYEKPIAANSKLQIAGSEIQELGVDPSKKICWFIGTFGRSYDLHTIIKTAKILDELNIQDVQFVLSGDGEKYSEWSELAQGLRNVVFTGWLDTDKICYLMEIADIGLAAYAKGAPQGLPNKFFEYMCCGLPILSSLCGEAETFLKEKRCGLTYVAGDVKSFCDKLTSLINCEDLIKELGSNSKAMFEQEFSADKVYSNIIDYLVNIVQLHRNPKKMDMINEVRIFEKTI